MSEPEGRFSDRPRGVHRPSFQIVVRPEPGIEPIRALRHLLKAMLRGYGLRCVSIKPGDSDVHFTEPGDDD